MPGFAWMRPAAIALSPETLLCSHIKAVDKIADFLRHHIIWLGLVLTKPKTCRHLSQSCDFDIGDTNRPHIENASQTRNVE